MLDEIESCQAGIFAGDHLVAHQFVTYELGGIPVVVDFANDQAYEEAMRVFGEIRALELWLFESELRRMACGDVDDRDVERFAAVPFISSPDQRQALDAANQMCSGDRANEDGCSWQRNL
jgi:hypothetical protein